MNARTLRRVAYALIAADGVLTLLAPRIAVRKNCLPWRIVFENVGELDTRPWALRAVRAIGAGMVAAGLTGLALERPSVEGEPLSDEPSGGPE